MNYLEFLIADGNVRLGARTHDGLSHRLCRCLVNFTLGEFLRCVVPKAPPGRRLPGTIQKFALRICAIYSLAMPAVPNVFRQKPVASSSITPKIASMTQR